MTNPIPPNPPPGQSAGYPPPGPGSYPQPQGYGPPPAPPEKGRSKALIALLCCIGLPIALVVVVAVVAAVAPKDNKTSTSPSTEAAGQPAAGDDGTSGPGATKDDPVPIGTEVTPAKNWTIKVNTANLDAGAELARANQFNKPRIAGNKLITVNVTIHNGSDKPGMAMTEMKVGALPPSGVKVDQSFAIAGVDTLNPAAQLQPGASVTGTLVFELPVADIPTTVLLAEPQFSLDENEDQRFLAIR